MGLAIAGLGRLVSGRVVQLYPGPWIEACVPRQDISRGALSSWPLGRCDRTFSLEPGDQHHYVSPMPGCSLLLPVVKAMRSRYAADQGSPGFRTPLVFIAG